MKTLKLFLLLTATACIMSACAGTEYDDTQIKKDIADLQEKFKNATDKINEDISGLTDILTAVQNRDYVVSCLPYTENNVQVGYQLTFATGDPVVIRFGKDGHSPVMGVRQDTDGLWYWTVDGKWLLDTSGAKVKAAGQDGKDGITPQLKIEDGKWFASLDGGSTWTSVSADSGQGGGSFFKDVTQDNDSVYLTLTDGTVITMQKGGYLDISFLPEGEFVLKSGSESSLNYSVSSSLTPVTVEVVCSSDIMAKVTPSNAEATEGVISVSSVGKLGPYSKIVVFVSNGSKVLMKTIVPTASAEIELKATLSDQQALKYGKSTWKEGDQIGVQLSDGSIAKLNLASGAGTRNAVFRITPPENVTLGSFAFYPYSEDYTVSGTSVNMTLPTSYNMDEYALKCPMYAHISGYEAEFKSLFAVVRIGAGAIPSTGAQVLLSSASSQITGNYSIDLSADTPAPEITGGTSNVTFAFQAPAALGQEQNIDFLVPAGKLSDVSVTVSGPGGSPQYYTAALPADNTLQAGDFLSIPAYPCIPMADFESDKAVVGGLTGESGDLYTVVNNPFPTELNSSPKVLCSSGIAGSSGTITSHRINLNPSTSNTNIPNIGLRYLARAARVKIYMGSDAGKYIPWGRLAWKAYALPSSVNGQPATAENVASLFKANDWNIVVWDYTIWDSALFTVNNFDMRPFCKADGSEADAAGARMIYYDDFQLLF